MGTLDSLRAGVRGGNGRNGSSTLRYLGTFFLFSLTPFCYRLSRTRTHTYWHARLQHADTHIHSHILPNTRVTGISPLYSIVFSEKKGEEVIHKQQIREFQELFCRIGSHWQDTHRLTLHLKPSYTCTPTYTRNIHAYTRRLLLVCTALFGDFSAGPRTRSWK